MTEPPGWDDQSGTGPEPDPGDGPISGDGESQTGVGQWLRWLAAGLVLTVVVTGAWILTKSGDDNGALGYGGGTIVQFPPEQRDELPRITGRLLDGRAFDSDDLAGKVVVYNVWGSWCGPCRKEAPALRQVWEETRRKGVQFVGVNVKDNDSSAIGFEREFGITYPSIRTADSSSALLAFGSALASAVPSTLVVDREGRVAARVVGPTTYGTLNALVGDVLAEKEPSSD